MTLEAETSRLAINDDDEQTQVAARRLAQEARQAAFPFGSKQVKDVTEDFVGASKALLPGQLVKDEYFTLFESVGALEIMDPKMDSGFVPPGDSLEPDFDLSRDLSFSEVMWILDELLCLEMAWHEGYPLSQTLFTSVHLDRLLAPENGYPYDFPLSRAARNKQSTSHQVLRAYCLAVSKCIDHTIQVITAQNYYEEEDFVTHLFGRDLTPKISVDEVLQLLEDARTALDLSMPGMALRMRLDLRQQYLLSFGGIADGTTWQSMKSFLKLVNLNHSTARPIPEAFSPKVQRRLATSTPPRPMLELSWDEAYEKWQGLCADAEEAYNLTGFWIRQDPHQLQRAVWAFASRKPQPLMFPRAIFQGLLFSNGSVANDVPHPRLLLDDIRSLVLVGDISVDPALFEIELPSDPRHRMARKMDEFMDKAFEEYLNLYRMVCQNRCRIRRTFTQAIPLLEGLQQEAMNIDADIVKIRASLKNGSDSDASPHATNMLPAWVRYHKLQVMEWTVQLGFETDIYLPDELPSMYFILARLCKYRRDHIATIYLTLIDRMKVVEKHGDIRTAEAGQSAQNFLTRLSLMADATVALANGLHALFFLLAASKLLRERTQRYATNQLTYEARMKPFLRVKDPAVPSLSDLEEFATPAEATVDNLCDSMVEKHFKPAKEALALLKKTSPDNTKFASVEDFFKKDVKAMETTTVAATVAATQFKNACRKHEITLPSDRISGILEVKIPEPGKRYHDWWVVPQLKEKKK